MTEAIVYLLHFERPLEGGRQPQHYLGVSQIDAIQKRMNEHMRGSSKSRLTKEFARREIPFALARQWFFDEADDAFAHERQLKKSGRSYSKFCPLCNERDRRNDRGR